MSVASPTPGPRECLLPPALLEGAPPSLVDRFRRVLRLAKLRFRTEGTNYIVRSDVVTASDFVVLKPLQNQAGQLRADAARNLAEHAQLSEEEMQQAARAMRAAYPPDTFVASNSVNAFQLSLLTNMDSTQVLRHFLEVHPTVRLYALVTTDAFRFRDTFWRLAARAAENNMSLTKMSEAPEYPTTTAVSGVAYLFAAHLVCALLTARVHPLATVLETLGAVQIVVVREQPWERPLHLAEWPSGSGYQTLMRAERPVYRTRFDDVPADAATDLLNAAVAAANRLVATVNDPATWRRTDGALDTLERQIAWSSIDHGFNALAQLASEWWSPETVWAAFRALGILEAYWGGNILDQLLLPDYVKRFAVPHLPDGFFRNWAGDIVDNYARELEHMYPADPPAERPARVRQIRNLVHGTGVLAPPHDRARRQARLQALLGVDKGGLQLLRDVAVFWWGSMMMAPETHARSGVPPWAEASSNFQTE